MRILDTVGNTPLVQLRTLESPVPIYGKCEHLNPGGSIKDRLAVALVADGEKRGVLKPGATIVEATAGNTGMGLALVAAAKGYKLVCVMPAKMSGDKRQALKALGAEVMVTDDAPMDSPLYYRNVADRLAAERGWFLADQFRNPANVEAHYHTTGREIAQQLDGPIGAFVAGAGTGGTITGVGRFLKERQPSVKIVLADPVGSALAGWINDGIYGEDGKYSVEGIGNSHATDIMDRSVIDEAITISDDESYAMALRLQQKEGLLVGGSSGTTVATALKLAQSGRVKGPIVAILADSWDRYFSKSWMLTAVPQECTSLS